MRTNNRILPYPVLGNYDAVSPGINTEDLRETPPDVQENTVGFEYDLVMKNETIANLIRNGKAEYMCDVYCEKTRLQKRYLSSEPHFEFELMRKEISGHVGFEFFVVVKDAINYSNPDFNEDYSGLSFELEKGDLLAIYPHASYNASLLYEKLYAVGSFIKFKEDDKPDYSIDMSGDIIYILLPKPMFQMYVGSIKGNDDFSEIILSSLVNEALEYAIINYDPDKHESLNWADALKSRFKAINKDNTLTFGNPKDAHIIAQRIFDKPYNRLFSQLVELSKKISSFSEYNGTPESV